MFVPGPWVDGAHIGTILVRGEGTSDVAHVDMDESDALVLGSIAHPDTANSPGRASIISILPKGLFAPPCVEPNQSVK